MKTKEDINKWVTYYIDRFSLQEWNIKIIYWKKRIPDTSVNNPAAMSSMPQYKRAFLDVRVDIIKRSEIRKIIKHELLHLFHADYDMLLTNILNSFDTDILPESTADAYMKIRSNIVESLVTKIERIVR